MPEAVVPTARIAVCASDTLVWSFPVWWTARALGLPTALVGTASPQTDGHAVRRHAPPRVDLGSVSAEGLLPAFELLHECTRASPLWSHDTAQRARARDVCAELVRACASDPRSSDSLHLAACERLDAHWSHRPAGPIGCPLEATAALLPLLERGEWMRPATRARVTQLARSHAFSEWLRLPEVAERAAHFAPLRRAGLEAVA